MSYTLKQCKEKNAWDQFVARSPQGNVFCESAFLDALDIPYELFFVEEQGVPQLAVPVLLETQEKMFGHPAPFSMYQGPMFSEGIEKLAVHSRIHHKMKLLDYLLPEFESRFQRIAFHLHFSQEDLRSFQWFHYHEPDKGLFQLKLGYTGLIHPASRQEYLASIRKSRRSELKKAADLKLSLCESDEIADLLRLYELTFARQDIPVKSSAITRVERIASKMLAAKKGTLHFCMNPSGEKFSANLFLHDSRAAYYLIGANHPEYRNTGAGTYLLVENILQSFVAGLRYVDVCGINSPARGDFKTSLNAIPVSYFVVEWVKPGSL